MDSSSSKEKRCTYVILAPKIVRPSFDYNVNVVIENVPEPMDINLVIQNDDCNMAFKKVTFVSGVPQIVKMQLPSDAINGSYKLLAFGSTTSGTYSFLDSTDLEFEGKSKSIFIQTDKQTYKAGQLVQYRIFILSPELKPIPSSFNGYINDPNENCIKLLKNFSTTNGVYTGEFQLTDQPPLGDWKFKVELETQETSKVFQVQEYVLPKFEVIVEGPPYALTSDKEITATIKAKYTFGKPVSGKGKIIFQGDSSSFLIITYVTLENGEAKGYINVKDLLSSNMYFDKRIDITVTAEITEDLTGLIQKGSTTFPLYKDKVQLDVKKSSSNFKPGLKYLLYIKVSMPNDRPIPRNLKNRLSVTFCSHFPEPFDKDVTTIMYDVPENGMVTAEFVPPEDYDCLYAKVKYGKQETTETIYKFHSESKSYIELHIKTDHPKVGEKMDFEVISTANLDSLNYVILSHGTIVASDKLIVNNEKTAEFSINANSAMAPTACIVVYHARSDGEMVVAGINVKVDGAIQNNVSIFMESATSSTNDFVEPGQSIKVHGQTAPDSYVGVLGVDQSVILMSSGNDITIKDILSEMDSYNKKNYYIPDDEPILFGRAGNRPLDGSSSKDIFKRSGIVMLTNFHLYAPKKELAFRSGRKHFARAALNSFEPMECAYACAYAPTSDSGPVITKPKTRKHFPETWLWFNTTARPDGSFYHENIVPDSITTWIATAVSLNSKVGMTVSTIPSKLTVFRPFFVSVNLPYSVIRGETFTLQILIFNYLGSEQEVDVTLDKNDNFMIGNIPDNNEFSQKFKVLSDTPTTVSIVITPLVVGEIDIKVTAKTAMAADAEKRQVIVKPEGVTLYFNNSIFLDLSQNNIFNQKVDIDLPAESLVDGSLRAEVSAIVDILGPTINHLDSLVKMPYGCGEQNMINFVPNIIIAKYLTVIDQFSSVMKGKIMKHIEKGYQQQFSYQRGDGSYSAFGNRDKEGSTWLTAFVLKSFQQAKPYTDICEKAFKKGLQWLSARLTDGNYFEEIGNVLDHQMQGGVSGNVNLTAYILIATVDVADLLKDGDREVFKLSLSYLESELDFLKSPFDVALVSYALAKCKSPLADKAYVKLNALATKEENVVYWENASVIKRKGCCCPYKTTGISIQATGYALLTIMLRKDVKGALPIVKWLISQMNKSGGFQSTQDTVIGLEALAAFAEQTYSKETEIAVTFLSDAFRQSLDLKSADSFLLQNIMIPTFPKSVDINATGKGGAFVQVSWKYNVRETSDNEYFDLDIVTKNTFFGFNITVTPQQKNGLIIGMFVLEITMPSGYTADSSLFYQTLEEKPEIGRIEGKNGDTTVIIYYNEIIRDAPVPITIEASRTHIIENLKEVPVILYAYYEPEKRITKMYKAPENAEADVPMLTD